MPSDLNERVVLITGAGQGVGRSIAKEFASAGATVIVNDLYAERANAVAKELASLSTTLALTFDVTDNDAIRGAIQEINNRFGNVDILVHNAGVSPEFGQGKFLDTTDAVFRGQLELNTLAAINLFKAVLPGQISQAWGRIIQISSGAGSRGLSIGVSAYGASKAATEALIRHIAVEYGDSGITANSIALGLMDNVAANGPALESLINSIPVRSLTPASEAGAAAVWLSDNLSSHMTGQVIHLNGGSLFGR